MLAKIKYLDLDFVYIRREVGNNDLVGGLRGGGGCGNHLRSSSVLSCGTGGCVCGTTQHLGLGCGTATNSALVLRASGNNLKES